ncbi:non-muscle caldesmon-like isoform X2 [Acipenser oxyrinchus oxyrinchus]|uniref:Non-muscle caldesmon-like isoform X2 n=1 Tax=Acipenser oxyrinchus oxyrinchus TaxID=40147 RepID=A0AAD8G1R3_ACIOX|nr:non-muscle caldesmon-like isoform X2 [Acipenser oxyrinchus oxyrinchus]
MSSAIVRRNSSKIGLQNLLRLTAQRSIEDEEEIARERRRRAREGLGSQSSFASTSLTSPDNASPEEDGLLDCEFKPSYPVAMEEDEGFSDWTQKLERRRQKRLEEQVQGEEDSLSEAKLVPAQSQRKLDEQKELEKEWERKEKDRQDLSQRKLDEQKEQEEEWERKEKDRRDLSQRKLDEQKEQEEEWERKERDRRDLHEPQREETEQRQQEMEKGRLRKEEDRRIAEIKKKEEEHRREMEEKVKEKDGEVKVSYTSRAFLQQEVIHINSNGNAAEKEVTLHLTSPKRILRTTSQSQVDDDEQDVFTETEQKLEKIRRSHEEKESQEYEWLRQKQAEDKVELEELNKRREERRRLREEEERRQEQEELERQAKEEEEKRRMKEEIERRRMQAAEKRQKTLSTSSCEGDEPFSPLSPKSPTFKNENAERVTAGNTHSIIERTDSLNRSLKKSNSIKKIQPQVPISRIDNRLEQYTHAIESSTKEARAAKQSLTDIPQTAELVASKKSLWEGGEALSPSSSKGTPCKDTEGLKVGVSDLITQWVKGTPDGSSKNTPSKPSDVMAGDVLNKKNIWENKIDSTPSANKGAALKSTPSGKRYKFIVSGHGKYEKVPISDDNHAEYTNDGAYHEES